MSLERRISMSLLGPEGIKALWIPQNEIMNTFHTDREELTENTHPPRVRNRDWCRARRCALLSSTEKGVFVPVVIGSAFFVDFGVFDGPDISVCGVAAWKRNR